MLFGMILNSNAQTKRWYTYSLTTNLNTADLMVLHQSGSSKNFTIGTLAAMLNDTADVLRAEFPPLWRSDIADTADVLRVEIAEASTIDTAWARFNENVILKFINDSVGVGTTTPNTKLQVVGNMEAQSLVLNNNASDENILIGNSAGSSLTGGVGQYNVFIGEEAGIDVTTMDKGVLIGYHAGSSLVGAGGVSAVMIGNNAGANATDGSNLFIGTSAGQNVTGSFNTLVGSAIGLTAGGVSNNSFFGYTTGLLSTSSNSTFMGFEAGYNHSGSNAVLIGYESGEESTSSTGLTAVGYESAATLTTSDFHTVVGFQALDAVQTNDGSSVFGYQAGSAATGAVAFSAFGYQAGNAVTTGDNNSLFGYQSGLAINSGEKNSLFGVQTGLGITSGVQNTMIGYAAGFNNNVSGVVLLGHNAGSDNSASNVLFIDNSNDATPLIWGDFTADSVIINGDLRATGYSGGANAWVNESDRRLKENIEPINNGLDIVKGLQGVRFEWKDQRMTGQQVGFIAQDVKKVLPEVVSGTNPLGLQTAQITAVLVEAIKEQQKQIQLMYVIGCLLIACVLFLLIRNRKTLKA